MPPKDALTSDRLPAWYERLGRGAQFFMQLGFAGLFACVFLWQQWEANRSAKEERSLLWEEIRSQRAEQRQRDEEQRVHRADMLRAVDALNRAVDEFRRASRQRNGDGQ